MYTLAGNTWSAVYCICNRRDPKEFSEDNRVPGGVEHAAKLELLSVDLGVNKYLKKNIIAIVYIELE